MGTAEFLIIALVAAALALGYLSIYPKVAGNNFNKISMCDLVCSAFVFTLVGTQYWGSGYEFSLLLFSTNWFWFTLIIYALIEIPLAIWYFKKYGVAINDEE
ncbi:hypothetical protein L2747_11670 [Shewanella marinintestina]|uniref:hypothetical protein n=1 Tax=Shewanella marinintestina TaxID=190305 RepID=UPI00200C7937|nr:hypothetical protein [Shewanella marinintestina]MCL1146656.1 hypothetical protein [Shewanella marinintestina]